MLSKDKLEVTLKCLISSKTKKIIILNFKPKKQLKHSKIMITINTKCISLINIRRALRALFDSCHSICCIIHIVALSSFRGLRVHLNSLCRVLHYIIIFICRGRVDFTFFDFIFVITLTTLYVLNLRNYLWKLLQWIIILNSKYYSFRLNLYTPSNTSLR